MYFGTSRFDALCHSLRAPRTYTGLRTFIIKCLESVRSQDPNYFCTSMFGAFMFRFYLHRTVEDISIVFQIEPGNSGNIWTIWSRLIRVAYTYVMIPVLELWIEIYRDNLFNRLSRYSGYSSEKAKIIISQIL